MFMQDIMKLKTAFALVAPRVAPVVPAPILGGIVAGTLVEGECGWVAAETLQIGDLVQTLDGGLARIHALDRRKLHPQAESSLIHVPGGTHDACSDLWLVPGQHVLIDTVDAHSAPYLLVPAIAMTCDAAVRHSFPDTVVEVITPMFADEEVIFANSGVLLHCPSVIDGAGRYPDNSFFPRLDAASARVFLELRGLRLAV
ncbi:MAG: Hint domain-containing protein [Pseudorhodobacter sp.]|nr:Hint domain-containing protein [Pseudorhodobacter sp.]